MLSLIQNLSVLVAVMLGAMLFTALLNWMWPCERRQHRSDLIGWQLSVLGTTYAVILGFMLYTVWTDFGAANLNADLEASALQNVFQLAKGLPAEQRVKLIAETRAYADAVVDRDWPAMARGELPEQSREINDAMWRTLMEVKGASPTEVTAEDHAISELSDLTAHRRTRLLESVYRLPVVFWGILLVGAALTLISVVMFGSASPKLHALQVVSITLLITLTMLAIEDVNQPFRGWVSVSDYAFRRAQQTMHME